MGRHVAQRLPVRKLRRSYLGLLQAYARLLRDHRRLEDAYASLLETASSPDRRARQTTWGAVREAMDVETASTMTRDTGLLISPGFRR